MVAEEGKKAPSFDLPASTGGTISLADYAGKQNVVLYFYPKDMTPGCTTEACGFRDSQERLLAREAVVLGVSPDSLKSHAKFIEKHSLNFPLLADEDQSVCEAYGVWVEKSMYGRTYMGVERSTFLIDQKGKIAQVWRKVKVDGHTDEVLEALKAL